MCSFCLSLGSEIVEGSFKKHQNKEEGDSAIGTSIQTTTMHQKTSEVSQIVIHSYVQ